MAVTTRTIPATPYAGGTLQFDFTNMVYTSACILTSTRMVWTYYQTNPNWRFFHIIDTPGGWATPGATPSVTTAQMVDTVALKGYNLQMCRLNDNAFLIMDYDANASSSSTVAWNWWVGEIDGSNNIAIVSSGTWLGNQGPAAYAAAVKSRGVASSHLASISDNVALIHGCASNATQYWVSFVINYNTTTKALTFTNRADYGNGGTGLLSSYGEFYAKTIPGSSRIALFAASKSSTSVPFANTQQDSLILNTDGSKFAIMSYQTALDSAFMSETRKVFATNFNQYNYFSADGSTSQGSGQITNTSSSNPMILGAIDSNYFAALDRSHWSTVTPTSTVIPATGSINVKVMRREDSNFTTQSAASAATATGFTITGVPYIEPFWNHRPKMLPTGDWFWWGLDKNFNLAWNVLKNPS